MRNVTTKFPVLELPVANGNFLWGRAGRSVKKIIIHRMVGTWRAANTRFNNPSDPQHASVQYGVPLDPNTPLLHWVDESNASYNCGSYEDNLDSVAIEHEDGGDPNLVLPDVMYARSSALIRDIADANELSVDDEHVVPHYKFYATACPDNTDIERLISMAVNINSDVATLLRSDANAIVTLASVQLDTIDALAGKMPEGDRLQLGFEAAEVKRKMGATETRYTTNNHPV